MHPEISSQKKQALRLTFVYPGIVLGLVVIFGAAAMSMKATDSHVVDNAVRGMTAFSMLAFSLAALGYLNLRKCL